ncbi:hypothetical protein U1E44_14755 [Arenibacter sp. GZD96]|uniref:hypothetical protein n=1 Tax=Aurantibrevibacter litoralis TaxID=3106030 RepID=UPI002AFEAF0C|nr:hypothetical protein [Arenibacter sp. GZD-96]MEA1787359.1 hypothetical protein [Arenibacter sp. GZD-96]
MPIYTDGFKNNLDFDMDSTIQINALDHFKESLERYLLSEVTVRKCGCGDDLCHLVIGVHFNFTLKEMISCLQYQNNLQQELLIEPDTTTLFFSMLSKLYNENSVGLDIMELSLYLKDTSIIIEKIYGQSIPDQLQNILKSIQENYHLLYKNSMEVPYEIYIPVFEEDTHNLGHTLHNISKGKNNEKDYFRFWGLYFESEEDAVIYDVPNQTMEFGDLFMLNH